MTTSATRSGAKRGPYAKTARRRAEIVEAATTVFAARGYHGGSLRDIARQIDLSLTSLVHHFSSKSDLLEAVLESADSTADWFGERARQRGLKVAILELVQINLSRAELLRLLAIVSSEASAPDHPAHSWVVARYDNITRALESMILADVAAGRIRPVTNPLDLARILIATWDGLQLQWLLNPACDMLGEMSRAIDTLLPPADPGTSHADGV
jgi:AcrR family transcriptional regulator